MLTKGMREKVGRLRNPASQRSLQRERRQSLADCYCPRCRGDLVLRKDGSGVNECVGCGCELITEWEYQRRQRAAQSEAA